MEIHLFEIDFKKLSIIGYMTASRTLSSGSDHGSPVALMKHRLYWFPLLSGEKWLWDMGNNCQNQLNWKVKYAMAVHLTTIKSLLSSLYPLGLCPESAVIWPSCTALPAAGGKASWSGCDYVSPNRSSSWREEKQVKDTMCLHLL